MKPLIYQITFLLTCFTIFGFIGCQNNIKDSNSSNVSEKSPTVLRKELVDIEKKNPLKYLTVKATWKKNLIGETVIQGTITNNATLANFKDVQLQITWLTQTNTELSSETPPPIYDYFRPNESRPFKKKFNAPSAMAGFEIVILSATPM